MPGLSVESKIKVKFKVEPWKHQLVGMERAKDLPGFAFFFQAGTGKTGTTINTLRHKFNEAQAILRTLVFCPPIVVPNWKDEWHKHADITDSKVVMLRGTGTERLKTFRKMAFGSDGTKSGRIFITNYESLQMKELFELFQIWMPQAEIFDESHKVKSHESKRSKLADKLANPCGKKPFTYLLSGTPILNDPLDLFMQFKILDGGKTFGDNFWAFRNRYFYDKNAAWRNSSARKYFPDWQIRPGSLELIHGLIGKTSMSALKKDCLDLPPLVRQTIKVGMTKEQARVYRELAKEYIAFIEGEVVSTNLAITKALRLMQLASGFVSLDQNPDEDAPVQKRFKETPKLSALRELLEELTPHSKVLVWATWRENYAQIGELCKELGIEYVEVHGGISERQKTENVDAFKIDPKIRVFLGHPGSGGIGINLVVASYSIFYSRTFSLEQSLQAEARNHRGGSEIHEKITRIDLVCEGTIDEEVVTRLHQKEEVGSKVLREISSKVLVESESLV